MIFSTKYSYIALRIGIAIVFFWFGADKFIHPAHWMEQWITSNQLAYLKGIFEVLIGLSLITGVFTKVFSFLGILFLLSIFFFLGINNATVLYMGLIGGLLAVVLWPKYGDGER